MEIAPLGQESGYINYVEKGNVREESNSSIFAKFNDKDGKIDSTDVEYSKEGMVSQEIESFFNEFVGKTQKWTKELKHRFKEIINNFNNSLKDCNIEDNFAELTDLKLRPYKVIYNQGKVVQKLCYDQNGIECIVKYENDQIKEVCDEKNRVVTSFSYTDGLLTKKTDKYGNVTEYKYNSNNMLEQKITTDENNNVRQTNYEYNEKNQVIKETASSSYNGKDMEEDIIFTYEYDESNNKKVRAFLPDGREFENSEDAGFYLIKLYTNASFLGEKDIQQALGKFKLK